MKIFFIFLCFASSLCADCTPQNLVHLINSCTIHGVQATGSMKPVLDEKCALLVYPTPYEELAIGDIILFYNPEGELIVHRIWNKSSGGTVVLTRGDNNNGMIDPWYITSDQYVGVVVGIVREDLMGKVLTLEKKEIK